MMELYPVSHELVAELVVKPMRGNEDPDPAAVESLRTNLWPVLAVLDRALEGKTHLVGERFTLADMVYMPDLALLHVGGEGPRIEKLANVARWWKTISTRASWKAAASAPDIRRPLTSS